MAHLNEKGQLHRTDGPAQEWGNWRKEWYLNGKLHRTDGPAIEWEGGRKDWYLDDKRHRTDGPAVEWPDGYKAWYLNGEEVIEERFNNKLYRIMYCGVVV